MTELHTAPVKRVAQEEGTGRISEDAVERLEKNTESHLREVASEAASNAKHAGRKTVKEVDVNKALEGSR